MVVCVCVCVGGGEVRLVANGSPAQAIVTTDGLSRKLRSTECLRVLDF